MKFKSFLVEQLAAKLAQIETLKSEVIDLRQAVEFEKAEQKVAKRFAKEQAAAARIAKLEAKLAAAKAPKVGLAAKKAARKPSPVTVVEVV